MFAPLGEYLIALYGWRHSYLLYAMLIPGVLIPLILMFYRSAPASLGLQPDGDAAPPRAHHTTPLASSPVTEAPYTAALRTRAFWALFLVIFTIAFNTMTLLVHQNQYLVDSGFSQGFAAWMLGLSGILRSAGSIIWGSISDRPTREGSFTISAILGLMAMPCLMSAQAAPEAWRVILFVLLSGLGYGGTSVLYATAAADLFQGRHFGKILGILDMGFGLGAALGSYLAGVLFDRYQTYHLSFSVVIGLILVSILSIWLAAPRMARVKSGALASAPAEP
jgi:MFS family permease